MSTRKIGLVDSGLGNVRSVEEALRALGQQVIRVKTADEIEYCAAVVMPGVGSFGASMRTLDSLELSNAVRNFATIGRPLLGICLGMQLLLETSDESPGVNGLHLLPGHTVALGVGFGRIGWDRVVCDGDAYPPDISWLSSLTGEYVFFNHNYYVVPSDPSIVQMRSASSQDIPAVISVENVTGFQFHPERSQRAGVRFLKAWLSSWK